MPNVTSLDYQHVTPSPHCPIPYTPAITVHPRRTFPSLPLGKSASPRPSGETPKLKSSPPIVGMHARASAHNLHASADNHLTSAENQSLSPDNQRYIAYSRLLHGAALHLAVLYHPTLFCSLQQIRVAVFAALDGAGHVVGEINREQGEDNHA